VEEKGSSVRLAVIVLPWEERESENGSRRKIGRVLERKRAAARERGLFHTRGVSPRNNITQKKNAGGSEKNVFQNDRKEERKTQRIR